MSGLTTLTRPKLSRVCKLSGVSISLVGLLAAIIFPQAVYQLLKYRPDPDSFWHLATGKWMLAHVQVPYVDPFSSKPRLWYDHEWLSQVIFALFVKAGYPVLMGLQTIVAGVTFFIQHRLLRLKGLELGAAALTSLMTLIPMSVYMRTRPQIFTYLMSILLVWVLEHWQNRKGQWLAVLLIMGLWVNLHGGGQVFAFVVIGGYLVAAIVDRSPQKTKQFGILICLGAGVTLLNPYGWHMLLYPYQTMLNKDMALYIGEWQSPNFHTEVAALVIMLEVIGILTWKKVRLGFRDGAFVTGLTAMALMSARHLALLYLLAPVYLVDALVPVFAYFDRFPLNRQRVWRSLTGLAILTGLVVGVWRMIEWPPQLPAGQFYPQAAYNYLDEHHVSGRIYNPYNWGGSLIYRFNGRIETSIDGRADMYSGMYNPDDRFHSEMELLYSQNPNPSEYFRKYPVSVALVQTNSWLYWWLTENKDFHKVYQDNQASIFDYGGAP